MGVENGGAPQGDGEAHRRNVDYVDGVPVCHTPALEPGTGQSGEGAGAVPVEVFNRVAQLQEQLEAAQAKAEKYDRRLEKNREYDKRWRERDPEKVRELARERQKRHRARQRQSGGT